MKLSAILFMCVFVPAAFATASKISEIPPSDSHYQTLKDAVDSAAANSSHYLDIDFHGISGSLSYLVDKAHTKNQLQLVLVLNGKYFMAPMQLESPDNVHRFSVRPDGIYLEQDGFRVDLQLDRPARVKASLHIADANGNILPALDYDETLSQAQTADYLETHPRVTVANYFVKPRRASARLSDGEPQPDQQVGALTSGSLLRQKALDVLDWAENYDQVYYLDFVFNGITGRLTAPGRGLASINDGVVYAQFNDKVFQIPFNFWYFDNRNSFTREVGTGPEGIYLTQRGMRLGADGKTLYRVIAHIRIADLNGNVLDNLEYHETSNPATSTVSDILIEKDFF